MEKIRWNDCHVWFFIAFGENNRLNFECFSRNSIKHIFFACIKMINSNGMANFISQKWSRHTVRKHIWRDEPNTWDYHWLLVLICDYLRAHKDRERVVMNVADRRRLNESDCMFCVCAFQFDSVCLFFVSACTHSKSSKIKPNVN